jgi:outer membrane protein insertion porin family/translocation and assembly module TamA
VLAWLPALAACSKIPPGRSAIDSVRVVDTHDVHPGDVTAKLATQASAKFLFLFQGLVYDYEVYDEAVLQRDMARVERVYQSKGFFDAHARVAEVRNAGKNHVRVTIVVDEGPAMLNRNLVLVGTEGLPKDVADAARAAATSGLPRGARFDDQAFERSKDALKKALTDRGYAYAAIEGQAEADVGQHAVDYGFKVTPGPFATFGSITFHGLESTTPHSPGERMIPEGPLRRAIDIRPGQTYSTAEIASSTQALLDLGVFASVQIVPSLPDPPPADPVVPLTVNVEGTRLHQITLGGGVEIDEIKTDVHLVGGWEDHNFLGGLRDFAVTVKPGVVMYPVRIDNLRGPLRPLVEEWTKVELRQPGFIEARTTGFIQPQFNIFPLLVEVNPPANAPVVGYREVKVPIGVERTIFKKLYVAVTYNVQVENPFSYVQTLDPTLETVFLSYPELLVRLDFRDNAVRPHSGFYLGNSLQVAGGPFGGVASDVRVQPEARAYVPLARGLTFATRASVGFLWASNYASHWNTELENSATIASEPTTPGADLAARSALTHDMQIMYFRGFFSGGATTNRGFPLLGVSPHGVIPFLNPSTASQQVQFGCDPANPQSFNPAGCFLPAGGFTLWELQTEVRADVSGPLSVSGFCEGSDVSPNEHDIRLKYLHLTCGVGAAYDTPAGPIRVDIGYRIQPLQVLGYANETAAADRDPVNGRQPTILGAPIAIAIGIGEAF